MAEKTQGLRMATATKDDIKRLYLLYNVLENLGKYNATSMDDFDHFEEDEKRQIKRIFNEDDEIDSEELISYLHGLTWGFHRVVMGFEVLFDNCCDPSLDHLDWKPKIKKQLDLIEAIGEKLRAGESVTITPESEEGKLILEVTEEEKESEVPHD